MNLVDLILNIVGLLLWLNWRAFHLNLVARPGSSLVATLRAASPPASRWAYFGMLIALLLVRSFFYWQIGSALPWFPRISLEPTVLLFRSDLLSRMLFYSIASFAATLGIFYLWLLALSCINAKAPENDSPQKLIQLHLGPFKYWPSWLKLLLPFMAMFLLWLALHPLLAQLQMAPKTTLRQAMGQGAVIGLAVYLRLKYLLIAIFSLHLLNSYVYMGSLPFWDFINRTATNLLRPLRRLPLPLTIKKIDLAPVLGIALIIVFFVLLDWGERRGVGFSRMASW